MAWLAAQLGGGSTLGGSPLGGGTSSGGALSGGTPGAGTRGGPSTYGGGTLGPRPIDQLDRAVRQPLPSLPRAPAPRTDTIWVPDRYLDRPEGSLHVPGHWERRINPQEHYVPPLYVCNRSTGECAQIPAGVRPPPETRPGP
ncbi:MAG: hypothetical protein ACREM3_16640 [Candidatus Rokuibacteriota bacterium]